MKSLVNLKVKGYKGKKVNENNLLIKNIEEKYQRFLDYYTLVHTDFLTMEEQSQLAGFMRQHQSEAFFYGGYSEAERRMLIMLPDYTEAYEKISSLPKDLESNDRQAQIDHIITEFLATDEDSSPISVLEVTIPPAEHRTLGHRDYLGALMGQGIKREKLGDIIILGQDSKSSSAQGSGQNSTQGSVQSSAHAPATSSGKPAARGAQIIVASELADYLVQNFTQVGAASISTKKVPISNLRTSEIRTQELSITVSSPRLDNVISGVFNISRTAAKEAITRGLVFVSGVEVNKPDHSLKGGEKLVLRGSGKAIYHGPTGTSRKGKTYITITKYI